MGSDVLVPDHCLSFYFGILPHDLSGIQCGDQDTVACVS